MHSGRYVCDALTFTSSLLARIAAWTRELLGPLSVGGLFLHGPDFDLQEQHDVQNCPFPLHGHLFALWHVDLHWQSCVQKYETFWMLRFKNIIKPEFCFQCHCYCLRQSETLRFQIRLHPSTFQQTLQPLLIFYVRTLRNHELFNYAMCLRNLKGFISVALGHLEMVEIET